mmetsp:Transcript_121411/g.259236  ORF Transcript_121411/g.259236 Transcript_121411/m.259236 type:complete len:109 (+) Transcript_121411:99-425(+)
MGVCGSKKAVQVKEEAGDSQKTLMVSQTPAAEEKPKSPREEPQVEPQTAGEQLAGVVVEMKEKVEEAMEAMGLSSSPDQAVDEEEQKKSSTKVTLVEEKAPSTNCYCC